MGVISSDSWNKTSGSVLGDLGTPLRHFPSTARIIVAQLCSFLITVFYTVQTILSAQKSLLVTIKVNNFAAFKVNCFLVTEHINK